MELIKKIGRTLYQWWMKFARGLAIVNTTLLLSIVYFFLIGPISLVARLLRKDLLRHKIGSSPSFWRLKEPIQHTLEQSRHQF